MRGGSRGVGGRKRGGVLRFISVGPVGQEEWRTGVCRDTRCVGVGGSACKCGGGRGASRAVGGTGKRGSLRILALSGQSSSRCVVGAPQVRKGSTTTDRIRDRRAVACITFHGMWLEMASYAPPRPAWRHSENRAPHRIKVSQLIVTGA